MQSGGGAVRHMHYHEPSNAILFGAGTNTVGRLDLDWILIDRSGDRSLTVRIPTARHGRTGISPSTLVPGVTSATEDQEAQG